MLDSLFLSHQAKPHFVVSCVPNSDYTMSYVDALMLVCDALFKGLSAHCVAVCGPRRRPRPLCRQRPAFQERFQYANIRLGARVLTRLWAKTRS